MPKDKIRAILLSSEFPPGPGGIGNHAYNLAKELLHNGCEVLVITPQEFVTLEESKRFNQAQDFHIITLNQNKGIISKACDRWRKLNQFNHSFHPDLLIATGAHSAWVTMIPASLHRLPWIAIGHGSEFGAHKRIDVKMTRFAFNQASAVVFVSRFTRDVAHRVGVHPRREFVIHNGADGQLFKPNNGAVKEKTASASGFSAADPLLLTVGNLTRRKGQEVVIKALPEVKLHYPTVRYLLAGLPTEKERLVQLASELNVQDNVHFLGNVDHNRLRELYQACDLFLMTSQRLPNGDVEGFGISVIEAALCAKPAIVSRESGLAEAVEDGVTGICVPEKDPKATAAAVVGLLTDTEQRESMGMKAYERARASFTWETVGKSYFEVIQTLLSAADTTT